MAYSFSDRSIGLAGVHNARELGGYRLPDGRSVRHGLLLRGGALSKATAEDLHLLKEKFNLSIVFDFRTDREVKSMPDPEIPGVRNIWLPAIDPKSEKFSSSVLPESAYNNLPLFILQYGSDPKIQSIASSIYTDMVENEYTQLQYAAFLQNIINDDSGGAVYWHCSQGKDRTGLGAVFLLAALGAPIELIREDFLISNDYYRPQVSALSEAMISKGGGEAELMVVQTFVGVCEKHFDAAVSVIEKNWGSMDAYLRGPLCLTDADMAVLRDRYLE